MKKKKTNILIASMFAIGSLLLIAGAVMALPMEGKPFVFDNLNPESTESQIYKLVNDFRSENKLSPLERNTLLEKSAQLKLKDMHDNNYFSHKDKDGNMSWHYFSEVGYKFTNAGENLYNGSSTPIGIVKSWENSPTHRMQLLEPKYKEMGAAYSCVVKEKVSNCYGVLHLGVRP